MNSIYTRIVLDVLALVSVVFGLWFVALPITIFCLFRFNNYWEIVILGIIYDSLFRMIDGLGWSGYMATIITLVLFVFYISIKGIIRR